MMCADCGGQVDWAGTDRFPNGKRYCLACQRLFLKGMVGMSREDRESAIEDRSGFTMADQLDNFMRGLRAVLHRED